jgi:hypothetical protein
VAEILGRSESPILLDPNMNDLQVRHSSDTTAADLNRPISKSFILEERPTCLVRQDRKNRPVITNECDLPSDRLGINLEIGGRAFESLGQENDLSFQRDLTDLRL